MGHIAFKIPSQQITISLQNFSDEYKEMYVCSTEDMLQCIHFVFLKILDICGCLCPSYLYSCDLEFNLKWSWILCVFRVAERSTLEGENRKRFTIHCSVIGGSYCFIKAWICILQMPASLLLIRGQISYMESDSPDAAGLQMLGWMTWWSPDVLDTSFY